jgi:methylenetetrahydrofolate--tRNA-(uracil-5-)-methyltransferase
MLGGLMRYLRESDPRHFAPMNSNFGLLEPLAEPVRDKERKRQMLAERAREEFSAWMEENGVQGGMAGAATR